MTRRTRSGWRSLVPAVSLGLVILAAPTAVAAADEPVTGTAISGATIDPATWPGQGMDAGPVLLLLVAGTLGLLGVLSGPELDAPGHRPDTRPSARAR
jgi:hypothetical protein